MNKSELKPQYSIFGNKGSVWSNACHIAKGSEPTTMCGVPMLSSNWARIEDVQEIGCHECLALYQAENKPQEPAQLHLTTVSAWDEAHFEIACAIRTVLDATNVSVYQLANFLTNAFVAKYKDYAFGFSSEHMTLRYAVEEYIINWNNLNS